MWFYWLSVADGARGFAHALAVISLALSVALFIAAMGFKYAAVYRNMVDEECFEYVTGAKLQRIAKVVAVVAAILFIIHVFIPSRETLIEMQIARFTTVENAEWALDAIKSATDYIVSAIKELQ
jgi:hypothetical protein